MSNNWEAENESNAPQNMKESSWEKEHNTQESNPKSNSGYCSEFQKEPLHIGYVAFILALAWSEDPRQNRFRLRQHHIDGGVNLPKTGRFVPTGGDDMRPVGAEGRRTDPICVPFQDGQGLPFPVP